MTRGCGGSISGRPRAGTTKTQSSTEGESSTSLGRGAEAEKAKVESERGLDEALRAAEELIQ